MDSKQAQAAIDAIDAELRSLFGVSDGDLLKHKFELRAQRSKLEVVRDQARIAEQAVAAKAVRKDAAKRAAETKRRKKDWFKLV